MTNPYSTIEQLMVLMDMDKKTMRMILDTAEMMGYLG